MGTNSSWVTPALYMGAVWLIGGTSFATTELTKIEADALAGEIEQCLQNQPEGTPNFEPCRDIYVTDCVEEPDNLTTQGMNQCTYNAEAAWDILLNKYYQIALSKVKTIDPIEGYGDPVEIVKEAQRAWLVFRSKECSAARLPFYGGTAASTLAAGCTLDMTIERTLYFYSSFWEY